MAGRRGDGRVRRRSRLLRLCRGLTIFDFNRLRRAQTVSSVPIAAGIFLDIFNIFLLLLELFGGGERR